MLDDVCGVRFNNDRAHRFHSERATSATRATRGWDATYFFDSTNFYDMTLLFFSETFSKSFPEKDLQFVFCFLYVGALHLAVRSNRMICIEGTNRC